MDEAADRTRTGEDPANTAEDEQAAPVRFPTPSDRRIHEQQLHEEAERVAVEGDDLSEIFASVLGRERPSVDEPPPAGAPWPPPLGKQSDRPDADDPGDPVAENQRD